MTTEEMNDQIYEFLDGEYVLECLDEDNFRGIYGLFWKSYAQASSESEEPLDSEDYRLLLCRFSEFLYIDCKIEIFKFLEILPAGMFYKSTKLPSYLYIPKNIKHIGNGAFEGCTSLETVYIEDGCESIYGDAFTSCAKLLKIRLPKTLHYPEEGIFEDCPNLKQIYVVKGSDAAELCNDCDEYKDLIKYQLKSYKK